MMFILSAVALAASAPVLPKECAPLPGMEQVLVMRNFTYLLVGEYHGTVEMPAIAADALCAAAATGKPVMLGVEFPVEMQSRLNAYMRSDGGAAARAALLEAPAWKEEGGRSTLAVLDLIERARLLAATGYKVLAAPFDKVTSPLVSKERETGLAEGLSEAQARFPGSIVVALTGAGHADKAGWTSQKPPFPAAGGLLPQDRTISITFARPGGQYWGCQTPSGDKTAGCTAYDMPAREAVAPRGIVLNNSLRGGFDGVYHAGKAYTASRRALSAE